jgi:hypothetical protein
MASSQISNETKTALTDIADTVRNNTLVIADIQSNDKIIIELLNTVHQYVTDMSKKFDLVLSAGLKTPKTSKKESKSDTDVVKKEPVKKESINTKTGGKLIRNIMSYFKTNYALDNTYFNSFLEENQAAAVFAENEAVLSKKKGDNKIKGQASVLYKSLTVEQRASLRVMMEDEIEAASVNNDEDIVVESDL